MATSGPPVSRSPWTASARPKSTDFHAVAPAAVLQQDVLGLDVAVHEPGVVGGLQPVEQLPAQLHGLLDAQVPPPVEQVPQRGAGHVLHHDIGQALMDALVEHGHHVRMREPRDGLGLVREGLHVEPRHTGGRDHLHRDSAVEALVVRLVDIGHAAARDEPFEPIAPVDARTGQVPCRRCQPAPHSFTPGEQCRSLIRLLQDLCAGEHRLVGRHYAEPLRRPGERHIEVPQAGGRDGVRDRPRSRCRTRVPWPA